MEDIKINKGSIEEGYIYLPYITKCTKTMINNETVWYSNKWKNMFLKIKRFFVKSKYSNYVGKLLVPSEKYETITIKKD